MYAMQFYVPPRWTSVCYLVFHYRAVASTLGVVRSKGEVRFVSGMSEIFLTFIGTKYMCLKKGVCIIIPFMAS